MTLPSIRGEILAQILYNHLHFSKLPRGHLDAFIARRGYVQVVDHRNYNPRLIEYLTDSDWIGDIPSAEYLDLFLQKLDNPVEIWEHAFRNQLSDRARHLLFIITTMPTESRIEDVDRAFTSFHNLQCARFGIAHSATDFKTALKELDGTFVATRSVQESVLVRFQNPSIRDFMQNLLVSGELLPEVIAAMEFFEQAQWFMETLIDKQPRVSLIELKRYAPKVVDALQRLFEAKGCSLLVPGDQTSQYFWPQLVNPGERLVTVAVAIAKLNGQDDGAWMTAKIAEIASKVDSGMLSPSFFVEPIKKLDSLGYLTSDAARNLVLVLKRRVLSKEYDDLGDFEIIAGLFDASPQSFAESEVDTVRDVYLEFAVGYASDCDLQNPEEIREEAERIGNVGNLLEVDTEFAQKILKDKAKEIENEEESNWDEDDDRRGSGGSDACTDRELDSMFGTLGS